MYNVCVTFEGKEELIFSINLYENVSANVRFKIVCASTGVLRVSTFVCYEKCY